MVANAFVRARVNAQVKDEAAAVLAEFGLTVSDLVRMTLTRVAKDKTLPFELKVPNAETRAAMDEARTVAKARRGRFKTAQDLLHELDETAAGEKAA